MKALVNLSREETLKARYNQPPSLLLVRRRLDVSQSGDEIPENLGGHHDRVTISADVFGDLHDHAARVLFEIEIKCLPIR